jgi:hypothetical protein
MWEDGPFLQLVRMALMVAALPARHLLNTVRWRSWLLAVVRGPLRYLATASVRRLGPVSNPGDRRADHLVRMQRFGPSSCLETIGRILVVFKSVHSSRPPPLLPGSPTPGNGSPSKIIPRISRD